MGQGKVSVTVNERILLHLMRHQKNTDDFEVPFDLTQYGIAHYIGIQQKHIPRAMKKLKEQGLLEERISHIKQSPRKQKVYFLTPKGFEFAANFKNHIMEDPIKFQTAVDEYDEITVEQAIKRLGKDTTVMDVVLNLTEENILDPEAVVPIKPITPEDFHEELAAMEASKHEVYKTALKRAWADKQITSDEKAILDDLKKVLHITDTEHRTLESEAITELKMSEYLEIYEEAMSEALRDGTISTDEFAILEGLRKKLRISNKAAEALEEEVEKGNKKKRK